MEKTIQQYDVGYSDETVVQVLKEPDKAPESKSYMWLFAGGPPDKFGFIYQYHPSRSHDVAFNFWQSFKGFLHTDGYAGYSALFNKTEIGGVHCWAHARRSFVNITKTTKKVGLAHWAVAHIRKLYKIESQMKESGFTADQIKNIEIYKQNHYLLNLKHGLIKTHCVFRQKVQSEKLFIIV